MFVVLLYDWAQHNYLSTEEVMQTLAIIYTLFGGVNMMVYFSWMGLQGFFAIVQRIA